MANTLQNLRRGAGFRTAKDFAEAVGIPTPTYTRYEQDPSKIPIERAWILADKLKCSIDAVVGREHIDVGSTRGEFQKYIDSLSKEGQDLLWGIAAVIKGREKHHTKGAKQAENEKYDAYLRYYEQAFFQSLDPSSEIGNKVIFGTENDRRTAFQAHLQSQADALRPAKAAKACKRSEIMLFSDTAAAPSPLEKNIHRDDPHFDIQLRLILKKLKHAKEDELKEQDQLTILKIMDAYDRKYALGKYSTMETGRRKAIELLAKHGDIKLNDLISDNTDQKIASGKLV